MECFRFTAYLFSVLDFSYEAFDSNRLVPLSYLSGSYSCLQIEAICPSRDWESCYFAVGSCSSLSHSHRHGQQVDVRELERL